MKNHEFERRLANAEKELLSLGVSVREIKEPWQFLLLRSVGVRLKNIFYMSKAERGWIAFSQASIGFTVILHWLSKLRSDEGIAFSVIGGVIIGICAVYVCSSRYGFMDGKLTNWEDL